MYRSFVTCDDPKGVVECGTIRKSKIGSHKMGDKSNSNSRKTQKNSNTSLSHKSKKEEMVPKGITEEYHSPSSFQLLEVSKGANKLNHLIDSWSKGRCHDGQSKDIAKELLKGALDLQDSLTMLGKLQEASEYMAQLKKKQKEKSESRRIDEVGSERTNSHRSGDQNHQLGYQKPRLSADGSSKDCYQELRNAIRDGLARQNLLPNASNRGKTNFNRTNIDSGSHIPSTSLSESSVVHSSSINSTGSSTSDKALQKTGKGLNLIAKLMGLEDIPSKPLMQPPEKQLDVEKNLSQRWPVFDIEMPKLRNPQPTIQKVDSERRTLKELLENVQLQGLLKGSSTKELKYQSHQSGDFHSKQRQIEDIPRIVLIKPLRVPCFESEEALAPMVREEGALKSKMLLRKINVKEEFSPRLGEAKEGTSNASKLHCKTKPDETPIEKLIQKEGAKDQMEVIVIPEEKEVRTIDEKKGDANVQKNFHIKLEAEKAPIRQFSQGAKDRKEAVGREREKETKKKPKDSSNNKGSNTATHQQRKKEMTNRKVDEIQKVATSSRKPVDREIVKTKRHQAQAKMTSTKLTKPENRSITTNGHISLERTSTRKTISRHTTQPAIHNSKDRNQKDKQATENTAAKPMTDDLECKEDEKNIDLAYSNHLAPILSTTTIADQLSTEEAASASKYQTEEHCDASHSSLHVVSTQTSEFGNNAKSSEEANDQTNPIGTDFTSFKSGTQLKDLLLTSTSFLNMAEEVFHLNPSYSRILPASGISDSEVTYNKLFLDYANEFIERRSLPDSQTRYPPLMYVGNSRICISLDWLLEEVSDGIETLRSYHKLACDDLHVDSLYATMETDIWCKGVVSGIWDLGWRNGFSAEDVEEAVNEVEKLLVSELIGEVLS